MELRKPESLFLAGAGIAIGRFQVDQLHAGHRRIVSLASRHQKTLVFVGVHPSLVTAADPLDFATRERMLRSEYPNAVIIALPDHPSDVAWSEHLDEHIRNHCPLFAESSDVTLYSGRDGFASQYHGRFPIREVEDVCDDSGARVRDRVGHSVLTSTDFRAGVIYASRNQRGQTQPTVDIAVTRTAHDGTEVLLGKWRRGDGKWRFPGGFVDLTDQSLEAAARRELSEETGLQPEGALQYVGSFQVRDWRESEDRRLMTTLFHTRHSFGPAIPADDLGELAWQPIGGLSAIQWSGDHKKLAQALCAFLEVHHA